MGMLKSFGVSIREIPSLSKEGQSRQLSGWGGSFNSKRMALQNRPSLKAYRRQLRNHGTSAEAALWSLLKQRQLKGRKFRRQHSIGSYILDFYCSSERLAIELDGAVHNESLQADYDYDYERTLFLEALEIRVIRIESKVVFESSEEVLEYIASFFGEQDGAK